MFTALETRVLSPEPLLSLTVVIPRDTLTVEDVVLKMKLTSTGSHVTRCLGHSSRLHFS